MTLLRWWMVAACLVVACGDDDGPDDTPRDGGGMADASRPDASLDAAVPDAARADGGLDFRSFDQAMESAISRYNAARDGGAEIVGASAAVITADGGTVHTKGYGTFAADRVYLIASASKILAAGVLLRLADQGKLSVDAPISAQLDEWGAHKTGVSVAQLVSNSSGLPSLAEISAAGANPTGPDFARLTPHFCQYNTPGSLADCGKAIYQDDAPEGNREPDKVFRYGGSQWQLAGALAEQVSGKKWAELIRETYVDPCGAASLAFTNPYAPRTDGTTTASYPAWFQGKAANAPATENPNIEGGAYANAPDYAKLLLMHLRGGKCGNTQVLSENAVRTMQTDRVAKYGGKLETVPGMPAPYTGYGMGWWLRDDQIADPGAYGAYPFLDLKRGYGAVILFEVTSAVGTQIALSVKPSLDAIFDAR
ncbi:MAG: serine hydrolase domain-containing protein [Polyangiales bacterium]